MPSKVADTEVARKSVDMAAKVLAEVLPDEVKAEILPRLKAYALNHRKAVTERLYELWDIPGPSMDEIRESAELSQLVEACSILSIIAHRLKDAPAASNVPGR